MSSVKRRSIKLSFARGREESIKVRTKVDWTTLEFNPWTRLVRCLGPETKCWRMGFLYSSRKHRSQSWTHYRKVRLIPKRKIEVNTAKTRSRQSKREGKGGWKFWHWSELISNIILVPAPLYTSIAGFTRQGRGIKESCHVEMSEISFEARKSHT